MAQMSWIMLGRSPMPNITLQYVYACQLGIISDSIGTPEGRDSKSKQLIMIMPTVKETKTPKTTDICG